jgi:hypothetical protein
MWAEVGALSGAGDSRKEGYERGQEDREQWQDIFQHSRRDIFIPGPCRRQGWIVLGFEALVKGWTCPSIRLSPRSYLEPLPVFLRPHPFP